MDTLGREREAQKAAEDQFTGFCLKVWKNGINLSKQPPTAKRLPVRELVSAFLATLSIPHTEVDKRGLIAIFSDHGEQGEENPTVTQRKLMMFMLRFGPPEATLAKVRDVLQHGKIWFHGNQDRETSTRILMEVGVNGSFLLRYSSVVGCFTVDYVKNNKISHFNNIRNDTEGGIKVVTGKGDQRKEYRYTNLSAFINRNKHIFVVPCMNARSHFQWLKQIPWDNFPPPGPKQTPKEEAARPVDMDQEVNGRIEQCLRENKSSLDLRSCRIGPEISRQLFALTELVNLDLSGNRIEFVPPELGNITTLESINLSDNSISRLPQHLFNGWQRLESFLCSENDLTEIPDELFGITTILHMDLSYNNIDRIPGAICKLTQLQFLQLSNNKISELPSEMAKLDALEELYLNTNRLKAIPKWITNLSNLFLLDVSENQIAPEAVPLPFIHFLLMNPGFEFRYDGNPGLDVAMSEGKKQFEGSKPQDTSKEYRRSVDIFSILKIKQSTTQEDSTDESTDREARPKMPIGIAKDDRASIMIPDSSDDKPMGTSLWLPYPGYRIEYGSGVLDPSEMRLQEHINFSDYRKLFFQKTVHTNIVGIEKTLGPVCISIQKLVMKDPDNLSDLDNALQGSSLTSIAAESGSYRVLFREKSGDRRIDIPAFLVKLRKKERFARSEDLLAALKKMVTPFSTRGLYVVRDPRSHESFALLEDKLTSNSYKFGVLYAKDGQDETAMYNNVAGSPEFEEFVNSLGSKIMLMGWQKYKGGLSTVDPDLYSIYTEFQGLEVMFHVSTYLPHQAVTDKYGQQWERKRFLGNDICVIIFYEGTSPINPSTFLSNFNHVFALVTCEKRKDKTYYKLDMAFKNGVAESLPHLPDETFERGEAFRTFLLTKLINAERCAMSAPQFCRTQERVRKELFQEMVQTFPKPKKRGNLSGRRSATPEACYLDKSILALSENKKQAEKEKKKKAGS